MEPSRPEANTKMRLYSHSSDTELIGSTGARLAGCERQMEFAIPDARCRDSIARLGAIPLPYGLVRLHLLNILFGGFYHTLSTLRIYVGRGEDDIKRGEGDQEADFLDSVMKTLNGGGDLRGFGEFCQLLDLKESAKYVDTVRHKLSYKKTSRDVVKWLDSLISVVENEGGERYVFHFSQANSQLFREERPKWRLVEKAFSATVPEIKGAISCHAFGEHTASVFHCMRIAELGLRAVARERRVKVSKKPLEWADWNDILTRLKVQVDQLNNKRRGPARDAALDFYRGVLGEFEAFKDVYRNNVMHVRKVYDEHESASVLFHVREFMLRLSTKIGEDTKKQIKWGLR